MHGMGGMAETFGTGQDRDSDYAHVAVGLLSPACLPHMPPDSEQAFPSLPLPKLAGATMYCIFALFVLACNMPYPASLMERQENSPP